MVSLCWWSSLFTAFLSVFVSCSLSLSLSHPFAPPLPAGLSLELNKVQQHILGQREFSKVLTDEIAFLTVASHAHMKELVRLTRLVKQMLSDLESLIDTDTLVKTLSVTHDNNHHVSVNEEMCVN